MRGRSHGGASIAGGCLLDIAETRLEMGQSLPTPNNPNATDSEMDFEEPIYLHLSASTGFEQTPAGEVAT
jgi:hypothetical protein